jgi:3-dehydroquinate dehydratase type I
MKICIPITAGNEAEALKKIRRSVTHADLIELRMDLISGGNVKRFIGEIRRSSPSVGIIVTNRRRDDSGGGMAASAEKKRFALLEEAVRFGADYVDVELDADAVLRDKLRLLIKKQGGRTILIVSHHDFAGTPSEKALREIFRACVRVGADVVKIATVARHAADNLKVLSLIPYGKRKNKETIAFCMGEEGRVSRILAPFLGSLLSFASLEIGAETAPGQFTAGEMKRIYGLMQGKRRGGACSGSPKGSERVPGMRE